MIVDLRSDTLTKPTTAMREAIAQADVGDDVFGEDPTVNDLQDKVASMLGKEAGLFVASGTMGNEISVCTHTNRGDEIILERHSHIFNYETGAPALLSGVQLHPLNGNRGVLLPEQIREAIRPENDHFPTTRLICLENTHNRAGGTIYPLDMIRVVHEIAKTEGLQMHLDGARLWNASVATGISLKEYASYFNSVSVCFSKGLGAPVGSLVAADKEFIARARKYRKICGGGMRQVGILAAGALYAVEHHIQRLTEDHRNVRKLAEEIATLPGISIDLESVQTNIVIMQIGESEYTSQEVVEALKTQDVLVLAIAPKKIRAVTHLDVSEDGIDQVVKAFRKVFSK